MKFLTLLFFSCLFLASCKKQPNIIEQKNKENTLVKNTKSKKRKVSRDFSTLVFNNGDTLDIVSNFHTKEKIDAILTNYKKLNGKYFYCEKSGLNKKIFNNYNEKEVKKIRQINTAHNIIIGKDTVYFSGFKNVKCFKKNDNVLIASIIYTFYQKGVKTNLLIIDKLIKK